MLALQRLQTPSNKIRWSGSCSGVFGVILQGKHEIMQDVCIRSKCLKVEKSGHAVGLGWIGGLCAAKMLSRAGRNEQIKCRKVENPRYALGLWLSGKDKRTKRRKDRKGGLIFIFLYVRVDSIYMCVLTVFICAFPPN